MIDMKMTPAEAREYNGCTALTASDVDLPAYPYGLCISLSDDVLKKLGIGIAPVGTKFLLHALVEVENNHASENQKGTDMSMSLQITSMELGTPDGGSASLASRLYPNQK